MNGVSEVVEHYEGGGAAEAPADASAPPESPSAPDAAAIPMDQLKQMLASQLEYYFSRYVRFCIDEDEEHAPAVLAIITGLPK